MLQGRGARCAFHAQTGIGPLLGARCTARPARCARTLHPPSTDWIFLAHCNLVGVVDWPIAVID